MLINSDIKYDPHVRERGQIFIEIENEKNIGRVLDKGQGFCLHRSGQVLLKPTRIQNSQHMKDGWDRRPAIDPTGPGLSNIYCIGFEYVRTID